MNDPRLFAGPGDTLPMAVQFERGVDLARNARVVVAACLLTFMFLDAAHAVKPQPSVPAEILRPSGHTLAGPGSYNLAIDQSVFVYESSSVTKICVTLVVTAPDVVVRLNVENFTTLFVTDASSRAFCSNSSTWVELRCDVDSAENCTGFWRVDFVP